MRPRIDIHTHILPENWPDLRERYGYGRWVSMDHHKPGCARMMIDGQLFREVEANLWDPSIRLGDCDRHGVRAQVLSTVPVMFSYWAKPEDALDLSMILNDHLAGVVSRFPGRFAWGQSRFRIRTLPSENWSVASRTFTWRACRSERM